MFWFWPMLSPVNEAGASGRRDNARPASATSACARTAFGQRSGPVATDGFPRSSRDAWLYTTTTLSRTFEGLRRFFGRVSAALTHERWMHQTFDWALTPMQRLLPSAWWALTGPVRAPRGVFPFSADVAPGRDPLSLGFAWWRSLLSASTPPGLAQAPSTPLLALPPADSRWMTGGPGAAAALAVAPMLGAAMTMSSFLQPCIRPVG